jgi:hypothetical protein
LLYSWEQLSTPERNDPLHPDKFYVLEAMIGRHQTYGYKRIMNYLLIALLLTHTTGCLPGGRRHHPTSTLFHSGKSRGKADKKIKEVSGIAFSIKNPGMLWAINDGGNGPQLFLLNEKAEIVMTCDLDASNLDWEAMSIYYDSLSGKPMILIGDIGDNTARKNNKVIYRIEEPLYTTSHLRIDAVENIELLLPDNPVDMEAMFMDPVSMKLYLFSKREDSVRLFCVEEPFSGRPVLKLISRLPFKFVVDACISLKGDAVMIKDYRNVYYWRRNKHSSIEETLLQTPQIVRYKRELQGESVTFSLNTDGYYTVSESVLIRAKLFHYSSKISRF